MIIPAETMQLLFVVFAAATIIITTSLELSVMKLNRRIKELEAGK